MLSDHAAVTHDEIVAKVRAGLPDAEECDTGTTTRSVATFIIRRGGFGTMIEVDQAGYFTLWLEDGEGSQWDREFKIDRLDDALTIARLWLTLGEPADG